MQCMNARTDWRRRLCLIVVVIDWRALVMNVCVGNILMETQWYPVNVDVAKNFIMMMIGWVGVHVSRHQIWDNWEGNSVVTCRLSFTPLSTLVVGLTFGCKTVIQLNSCVGCWVGRAQVSMWHLQRFLWVCGNHTRFLSSRRILLSLV